MRPAPPHQLLAEDQLLVECCHLWSWSVHQLSSGIVCGPGQLLHCEMTQGHCEMSQGHSWDQALCGHQPPLKPDLLAVINRHSNLIYWLPSSVEMDYSLVLALLNTRYCHSLDHHPTIQPTNPTNQPTNQPTYRYTLALSFRTTEVP